MPPNLRVIPPVTGQAEPGHPPRRHDRVPYERPAELELAPSIKAAARMLDISEGGFRVSAMVVLEVGREVAVRYVEPGTHSVRVARAVTRWVGDGPRGQAVFGFSFEPHREAQDAIRNFVRFSQLTPRPRGSR
jgi:hypothetical protein